MQIANLKIISADSTEAMFLKLESAGVNNHLPKLSLFLCGDYRAYPGSEFVVANTLAKLKKLEPNEISFSQDFSQKVVSTNCFVFNSLLARGDFCWLLITFANVLIQIRPDKMLGLIWIQTV